jgi:ubiquinone/menaquinone biosynthesis C-methylase UbiE
MTEMSGFQVGEQGPQYYETCVKRFMEPFVDALVVAGVRNSETILDVACGTGFATRAASEKVGPAGRVVGSDINLNMLALAQSVPHGENVSWQQASALELPFEDNEFDAVICQQGVQFFPDIAVGLREMARVSGQRVTLTAFSGLKESPYFATAWDMLTRHCGTDPSDYAATFCERDEVAGWFASAGLTLTRSELVEAVVTLPPLADYLPEHLRAVPFAEEFFNLDEAAQEEAVRYVDQQLSDYRTKEGLQVPFRSYLASTIG